MHHIRNTLPEIKAKIQAALAKYLAELATLGDGMSEGAGGQANIVLNIITEFCTEFRTIIDGNSTDLTSFELSGGARISFVFHELYSNGVKALDPFDQVKDVDIRTILYNSSVSQGCGETDTHLTVVDANFWFYLYIFAALKCRVPPLHCLSALLLSRSLSSNRSSAWKTPVCVVSTLSLMSWFAS